MILDRANQLPIFQRLNPEPTAPQYQPVPAQNYQSSILRDILPYINPIYTQQQPMDSLAPMKMYQDYKSTGQVNDIPGMYQPFNAPQMPTPSPVSMPGVAPSSPTGGK